MSLLRMQGIRFSYGPREILHGIDLVLEEGQFAGLLGPNGSGKSTLLRVASGALSLTAGQVLYREQNLASLQRKRLARDMAFLSQDFSTEFDFTVEELVLLGRTPHLGPTGWETAKDRDIARQALEDTGTLVLAERKIWEISGGERQMALVAMCLAQEPKLLLLDEPSSHLDVRHQFEIMELLSRFNRERGMTLLLVSHDLNLAASYCDKVFLLGQGHIADQGPPASVFKSPTLSQVYGIPSYFTRNPLTDKPHLMFAAPSKIHPHPPRPAH